MRGQAQGRARGTSRLGRAQGDADEVALLQEGMRALVDAAGDALAHRRDRIAVVEGVDELLDADLLGLGPFAEARELFASWKETSLTWSEKVEKGSAEGAVSSRVAGVGDSHVADTSSSIFRRLSLCFKPVRSGGHANATFRLS